MKGAHLLRWYLATSSERTGVVLYIISSEVGF
jgi:hypothetical protein